MRHDRADDGTVVSLHWRYGEVRVAVAFSDAATRFLARLADPRGLARADQALCGPPYAEGRNQREIRRCLTVRSPVGCIGCWNATARTSQRSSRRR
jgi:hypothetical protein